MNASKHKIAVDLLRGHFVCRNGMTTFDALIKRHWLHKYDVYAVRRSARCRGSRHAVALPLRSPPDTPVARKPGGWRLMLGYWKLFWRDYRCALSQRRMLRGRILVLNSFGCETLPPAFRLACPRNRMILIAHTHPGDDAAANHPLRKCLEKICAVSADFVVFNSHENRRLWERKLGRPVKRAVVIHHGLQSPESVAPPPDYPPKPDGALDFVYVGQFTPGKGQLEFLDAWAMALKNLSPQSDLPCIRLIFVGDGTRREAAEAHAAELGVSDSVVFMGTRPEGADYFNHADVAVLMSQRPEAFGFVLLEAMSRAKPVLASRIGGIPEVVADGQTGLLADPGDANAVAANIVRLARDAGLRERLGAAGKQRWRDAFSVERMLKEYACILKK